MVGIFLLPLWSWWLCSGSFLGFGFYSRTLDTGPRTHARLTPPKKKKGQKSTESLNRKYCLHSVGRRCWGGGLPTAWYWGNFFVACSATASPEVLLRGAGALSALLGMPVRLEGSSRERRRVRPSAGPLLCCVLAFRNEEDRQAESSGVTFWPGRDDPRLRQLLHSLVSGLATKICQYHAAGTPGFTASWRRAFAFVKRRQCLGKWWRRILAFAAMRQGAALVLLPRALREAVGSKRVKALGAKGDRSARVRIQVHCL